MNRRLVAGLALALALSMARGAEAREPTPDEVERARTFFNAGAQAYASAKFADAVRSFEQAHALAPRPQVLFSLAQAERKEGFASGDGRLFRRAVNHYKDYLEQVPSGGRRSEATEAKADLEARLSRMDPQQVQAPVAPVDKRKARVTVYSATAGAQVKVDGGPPQELPYFGDLEPGKHMIRVFAEGHFDAEQEVSGDRPIDIPVNLSLREKPALVTVGVGGAGEVYVDGRVAATTPLARPIDVPPGTHVLSVAVNGKKPYSQEVVLQRGKPFRFVPKLETSGQRFVSFAMLGAGALGLVGGGAFALFALAQEGRARNIEDALAEGNISDDRLEAHNDSIERRDAFRTVALVSASAGVALGVGGAVLYFYDKPSVAVLPPRSVEPTPAPKKPETPSELGFWRPRPMVGPGLVGAAVTARF